MKPKSMSDEEKLKALVGTENPFRVPEGYFESFQQHLMRSLPERQSAEKKPVRVSMWTKARPWVAVAALFCGVIWLLAGTMHMADDRQSGVFATAEESLYSEEEMSDYMATSLFDEYTLYSYLTDDEY